MTRLHRIAAFLTVVFAAGCTTGHPAAPAPAAANHQSVVLVSLDGFRWDYLQRPGAVNLRRLAARGVHATRLVPSFPSVTFPNHYTIVTGLYPEHHGIIANTIRDSVLGTFRISDTTAVRDARWWGGEPIWVTAEKQGEHAADFFWPGSEAPIGGIRPWRWLRFDDRFPNAARVDSVLAWLSLPAGVAPSIVTLYYSDVDHAGHSGGPDAPATDAAIARVDSMIGRLMDGLASHGLGDKVNLIVLADHGMTAISPSRVIYLDDYVPLTDLTIVDAGPVGAIIPKTGLLDSVYRKLKGANPHMAVYRKADVPARFHYNDNPRITPLVLIADEGWMISTHASRAPSGGTHGYDNQLLSMGALFVAAGPAFKSGVTVPPFQNIHIYDLLCHILGLRPAPNDGSPDSTRALLRAP
ncbi:MAG TPA: ectonucleotide pyrophosphatase/phosphodiesterase [Gemmatimonadales bacterium]|nr:ectonucleotide pyrophosphatase/phosphodiesterase [Gemmatimonadales bacterium]